MTQVDFYGREKRTVSEARGAKADRFAEIFGEHVSKKSVLRLYTTGKVDKGDALSVARVGEFKINHSFRHSYKDDEPLVEDIGFYLKNEEVRHMRPLDQPIEPPEGYEHVSLIPTRAGPREDAGNRGGDPPVPASSGATGETGSNSRRWFPWLGLILLLTIVAIGFFVSRKTRVT